MEPKVFPLQHQNMYNVLYFLGYNTGAKFQLLCFSIYRDITDFVFLHLRLITINTYDVISFLISIIESREYLWNEKRY